MKCMLNLMPPQKHLNFRLLLKKIVKRDTAIFRILFSSIQPRVDQLQTQFNAYEQSQEQVVHILRHWDRTLLMLLVPVPNEDSSTVSEEAVSEKRVRACCLAY